jgi:hypothetical protein
LLAAIEGIRRNAQVVQADALIAAMEEEGRSKRTNGHIGQEKGRLGALPNKG